MAAGREKAPRQSSHSQVNTVEGKEMWTADLPASGHSTPVTFMGKDGKQYVVIAASGGTAIGSGRPISDSLVAFRLP